ncbi:MAG: HEAT repeat domain-containing protein [Candidatus Heimdallarchaeota archaeon]|nr:HEAT repeat domain-containing protein [Candidatus Heimdallarchaeota archaeon]
MEEQSVSEEEKQLHAVKALLETKTRNYEKIGSLLVPNEMMLLYKRREEVKLTTEEKELMLASCLAEQGPAWWFFRKERKEELTKMLIKAVKQRKSRKKAITFIANIRTKEALPTLQKAIENENWEVRAAAAAAAAKALGAIEIGKTLSKLIKDYLSNEITNREWLQAIIYLDEKLYCPLLKEEPAT